MKKLIYFLFFLSGAVGLTYQVVWARQVLLIFGNTTHSLVTVISTFMAGLALGSFVFGRVADKSRNLIRLWGVIEILIGLSALFFLSFLPVIREVYAPSGLAVKFLSAAALIMPATFFMGATLPVLVKHFSRTGSLLKETSLLYAANTLGAFAGTLVSAFVLIEVLGLRNSVFLGAALNFLVGLVALLMAKSFYSVPERKDDKETTSQNYPQAVVFLTLFVFFLSGGLSLSYEILWTRFLIPSLGTFVYAFAVILATVLLGIALGGWAAGLFSKYENKVLLFAYLELFIGLFAFFSLLLSGSLFSFSTYARVVLVILPASVFMGMTFPVVASVFESQKNTGFNVGRAYAINTAGSILGPVVTGFFLIPTLGTTNTTVSLIMLNIVSATLLVVFLKKRFLPFIFSFCFLGIYLLVTLKPGLLLEKSLAAKISDYQSRGWHNLLFEDEVATSLAFAGQEPLEKGLIIDGVQTTTLTTQTKLLSHLPLLLHPNPKELLVIAFGMGTTFRSALAHDIKVDAVELVPSVPKAFPLFFEDAESVLENENGKIIINDGRNYVLFTKKTYDVIVTDPPPPINAAGTTVLYSKEFYLDAKKKLNEGGFFVQWFWYGGREDDFKMLFKSFEEVFPHILVAVSPEGRGVYFIGSDEEISIKKEAIEKRLTPTIQKDLNEWEEKPFTVEKLLGLFVGNEETVKRFSEDFPPITDNQPRTEYFFVRHKTSSLNDISPDWVHPIPEGFKEKLPTD